MAGGRPTLYSKELADLVCDYVATHSCGLIKLCRTYPCLPDHSTVKLWRRRHPEFSAQYAQAKMEQADLLAEECLDIADDDSEDAIEWEDGSVKCNSEFVQRSRLRIDTRKWLASKLLPKQYGKGVDEHSVASETLVEKLIQKLEE